MDEVTACEGHIRHASLPANQFSFGGKRLALPQVLSPFLLFPPLPYLRLRQRMEFCFIDTTQWSCSSVPFSSSLLLPALSVSPSCLCLFSLRRMGVRWKRVMGVNSMSARIQRMRVSRMRVEKSEEVMTILLEFDRKRRLLSSLCSFRLKIRNSFAFQMAREML